MDHSDIDRLMAGACSPSDGVCHTTPMGESFPPHAAALTIKVGKGMKKRNREMTCLVPECSADLISRYEQRYRLCTNHMKVPKFIVGGVGMRFCQKCGKFHQITDFDGLRRSCRAGLARHNEKQRKLRVKKDAGPTSAAQQHASPPQSPGSPRVSMADPATYAMLSFPQQDSLPVPPSPVAEHAGQQQPHHHHHPMLTPLPAPQFSLLQDSFLCHETSFSHGHSVPMPPYEPGSLSSCSQLVACSFFLRDQVSSDDADSEPGVNDWVIGCSHPGLLPPVIGLPDLD